MTPRVSPNASRIGARLQGFHEEWEALLSPELATCVKRGYHWQWKGQPPRLQFPRLAMQSSDVQVQVQRLLDLGAIYVVDPQPCFLSRIFVVPKVPTGWRLTLDVSALSEYIVIPSFKMSNHASLRQALSPPVWLACLDLKDAYLHVPIRNMEPSVKEPSPVYSSIALGQDFFLQGSPVRVSHCSVSLHHT